MLNKNVSNHIFSIPFLILSLISCSKEKSNEVDDFKLSPPHVERNGVKNILWREINQMDIFETLPNDEIVFNPADNILNYEIQIESRCSAGKVNSKELQTWQNPSRIKIKQLVPITALLSPPGTIQTCRFDMMAKNKKGSRHIFNLPKVQWVSFNEGDGIIFKKEGLIVNTDAAQVLKIPLARWDQYWLVPQNPQLNLVMDCLHHKIPLLAGGRIVPMVQFSYENAEARDNKQNLPMSFYPKQFCRITNYENGHRMDFSTLVEVEVPILRPQVSWKPATVAYPKSPVVLGQIKILNPFDFTLVIEIPPFGKQTADIITVYGYQTLIKSLKKTLQLKFDILEKSSPFPVEKSGEVTRIHLPPKEFILLNVLEPRIYHCLVKPGSDRAYMTEGIDYVQFTENLGPDLLYMVKNKEGDPEWNLAGRINVVPSGEVITLPVVGVEYPINPNVYTFEEVLKRLSTEGECIFR
ncbi:MAG: hypothetical protein K1X29_01270 [Bdellovibrionales bacterium]|nr:hypothetical protein [Bdellovibrionales bacterium]